MENRSYSAVFRVLHWAIGICMLLLLLTIFLRLTWMNRTHMAEVIQQSLDANNVSLEAKEVGKIARNIREPMWQWHIYLGYVLVGLFSLRFLMHPFGKMLIQNPFKAGISRKVRFQYAMYVIFYVLVVVSLSTGLLIEHGPRSIHELMEEIHVLSIYYLLAFIVLHLGGVLLAEFTTHKGLISRVISGEPDKKP
ncbi:cytochrome b/b6 domain-containing protein [Cytophagales bacterium LB-30]|uniref:Cytochrome b/b6 domain-containing protein n=1 Tax=Shiella aurantiaca TaxID=3058365 RepID=A0ABT8F6A3_9BACT|nr:cytochrome b/b6 domain-containing protein [Shiella aurantiaca]MDN4166003.1 cytochrome b/b6 domain-containing protein [Shiella aurantiaca]